MLVRGKRGVHMSQLNNKGLSSLKLLLLVVVTGIIGGTGYFIYHTQSKTSSTLSNTAKTPIEPQKAPVKTEPVTDETKDWIPYSSQKGKFSLRYPATWLQPEYKELCNTELFDRSLYLGPDKNSVLKCGSEFFGQISVSSVEGNKQSEYDLSEAAYKNVEVKPVTVAGVTGKRISGIAKAPAGDEPFAPTEGTIEVHYVFFANGNTYAARYTQVPTGNAPSTDVLKDFDVMIVKTLSFKS
jgi:hypothetical protein